ncbi:MAG: CRTAC1 family protein [Planctomycetota bacterium]|jgi:hypothetical protein
MAGKSYRLVSALAGVGLVGLVVLFQFRQPDAVPADAETRFVNVAADAGLNVVLYCGGENKDHILESVGSGAAFLDFDQDDQLDIYLVNAWRLDEEPSRVSTRGRNVLYRNLGNGSFEDVSEQAGVGDDAWGCGVCSGDFDGDGREDLYVTNFGPNRLYRSRPDGTFEESAVPAGVADSGWGAGCAFFDAEGDGDLDLYVANYIDCTMDDVLNARRTTLFQNKISVMAGPFGLRGGRDRFYLNQGDGSFKDATDESGMTDVAEAYGLGVLASDLDNDGDVDVYVANDSNPNYLYRNDGSGQFTDVGLWSGAGYSSDGAAQAGMGVDAADIDGDGWQEIFVTNFAGDHCTLYKNVQKGFFEDTSAVYGIKQVSYSVLSWGCAFFDADGDADQDLLILNGHIYPQVDAYPELNESYRQLPIFLKHEGGRFLDASRSAGPGLQEPLSARGLALGDYDNDGDLDLLVTAMDSQPLLLRNDTAGAGRWLKLRLVNSKGAYALNAVATITVSGASQMREVRSGSTYQSQSALDLHFGLGNAQRVEALEVRWPNGVVTGQADLETNQTIRLVMPSS